MGPEYSGVRLNDAGEPECVDESMGMTSADVKAALMKLMPLIRERLHFLCDAAEMVRFLFTKPAVLPVEQIVPKKLDAAKTKEVLEAAIGFIEKLPSISEEEGENLAKATAESIGVKLGDFMMPIRMAVTGSRVSPPLIGSILILGADESVARVRKTLESF